MPNVGRTASAVCVTYLALASAAISADLPPATNAPAVVPAPAYVAPGGQFEARFGAYYGGGGNEGGTQDVSATVLSPRLNFGVPGHWAYLLPRFEIGGNLNLEGRTSFAYADAVLTLPLPGRAFLEPYLGAAVHNGSLVPTPTLAGLGCPVLFHTGVSVGGYITQHWTLLETFEHLTNGNELGVDCGTNQRGESRNQGLNFYGLRIGYAF